MMREDPLLRADREHRRLEHASTRRARCCMRDERGQALVEFAFVIPMILILVLGIIDFGRAYNYKNDVTSLANSAARFAEVDTCAPCTAVTPNQTIDQYVKTTADSSELQNGTGQIVSPGVTISFCFPAAGATTPLGGIGSPLQVTASATYTWLPGLRNLAHVQLSTVLTSSVIVRVAVTYDNTVYHAVAC